MGKFSLRQSLGGDCMKKIIAISVMLALVAGAVFAETSVGGTVNTAFTLAHQEGADGDDPLMGGGFGDLDIKLSGSNSDGNLGGQLRFRIGALRDGNSSSGISELNQAFVWWKPIEQVKIWLGVDADGMWDTCDFTGWGFHQGEQGSIFNHQWDWWRNIFRGNLDRYALAFSFYPIEGLDINLGLVPGAGWPNAYQNTGSTPADRADPTWTGDPGAKDEVFITDSASKANDGMLPAHLWFVGNYNLSVGKISFTYGGAALAGGENGAIGASFLLTAIENLQVKIGGSMVTSKPDSEIWGGLGVAWQGDGFGAKLRVGVKMVGDLDPIIVANILPYINVGENGQALIDIGITQDGNQPTAMGWSFTPAYRLNLEGGGFRIGLKVYNNINSYNQQISGADYVKWAVPMLLGFNF